MRAKMEISKSLPQNPIQQDVKGGRLRFYPIPLGVTYGALPQTYEQPGGLADAFTGLLGDGDPLDALDLSSALRGEGAPGAPHPPPSPRVGDVYPLALVGALALVDGGEADWKLVGVRRDDPLLGGLACVSQLLAPEEVMGAQELLGRAPAAARFLAAAAAAGAAGGEAPPPPPLPPAAAAAGRARLLAAAAFFSAYKKRDPGDAREPSPVSFAFEGRWLDAPGAAAVALQGYAHWCALVQGALKAAQARADRDAMGRARGHLVHCHDRLDRAHVAEEAAHGVILEGVEGVPNLWV